IPRSLAVFQRPISAFFLALSPPLGVYIAVYQNATSRAGRMADVATKATHEGQRPVRDDLVTLTYHRLRQAITSGTLTPGARVVERELGDALGVSRTPVRSALHRLQQEGYIVAAGNGAATQLVIAPLTRHDAVEL